MDNLPAKLNPNSIVIPPDADKDQHSRLRRYVAWMDVTGRGWAAPDLTAYRDHLLADGLAPITVQAYLSTVRQRYKILLLDRQMFFALTPEDAPFERRQALVNELIARIENAISPLLAIITVETEQDVTDEKHLRLTHTQAEALLSGPDTATLIGWRDLAVIALALCTGAREAEIAGVHIPDLRQRLNGQLALHVRKGKRKKTRLIPYGEMDWCLPIIDHWLAQSGIASGAIFRGVLKDGKTVRANQLSTVSIQNIVKRYPITVNGDVRRVRPHDLRRTYARWLYDSGTPVDAIAKNLGHSSPTVTWRYIGDPDVSERVPLGVFTFNAFR